MNNITWYNLKKKKKGELKETRVMKERYGMDWSWTSDDSPNCKKKYVKY